MTLEDTMAAEKDRNVRRGFDWLDIESKGLVVAAAGTDIAGSQPLASQHY